MATITRKLSDSASVSGGGGTGSSSPGIRPFVARKGSAFVPAGQPEEQAQPQNSRSAYDERLAQNRTQYEERQQAAENARLSREESDLVQTRTGNYERGGVVVQETRGDYQKLQVLGSQQPGSRLVQTQGGEYVLIKSTDLNLVNESTLENLNKNIALEGGSVYTPVSKKNEQGGINYNAILSENVNVGQNFGGSVLSPETKSEGFLYTVKLHDELGPAQKEPYQKTRQAQPREIAEMITAGELPKQFIGTKGADIKGYESIATEQQNFKEKQVFPITYSEKGKDIVTITGKGPGTEYQILGKDKSIQVNLEEKITTKGSPKPKGSDELFIQSLENIGIDVISGPPFLETGVPLYTKPIKERLLQERKETQFDLITQPERYGEINPFSKEFTVPALTNTAVFLSGAPIGKGKAAPKSELIGRRNEPSTPSTYAEVYSPARLPVSKFPSILGEKFKTPGFESESIFIGRGITKSPITSKPAAPSLVKSEPNYTPARLPVSKFKESYGITKSGFEETKISLGVGVTKDLSHRSSQTPLSLGKGEVKRPGIDFTESRLELGYGTVKTPPRVIGKQEGPPQPVKEEFGYYPERIPVSRFKESYGITKSGFEETKISLGVGVTKDLSSKGGSPIRLSKSKPPTKPSKETEVNISKGLQLIMEPQKEQQFTSTQIALGSSNKIYQKQKGKVIRNTLTKTKTKPSKSFSTSSILGSEFTSDYEYLRKPNEELKINQIVRISPKVTTREAQTIRTQQRERTEYKNILSITSKPKQKEKEKFKSFYSQPTPSRQGPRQTQPQKPIEKQKLIQELIEPPPKKPKLVYIFTPPNQRKERKTSASLLGSTKEFLGNVPQSSIIGVYKRKEVTYGDKTINALLGKERRGGKPKRRKAKKNNPYGIAAKFRL